MFKQKNAKKEIEKMGGGIYIIYIYIYILEEGPPTENMFPMFGHGFALILLAFGSNLATNMAQLVPSGTIFDDFWH